MDTLLYLIGMIGGAALGQFTVAIGWVAAGLAVTCGIFKSGWMPLQAIALVGGLIAKFVFSGTAVDERIGGLAGSLVFNVIVYGLIALVGYGVGWVVRRVVRKDAGES